LKNVAQVAELSFFLHALLKGQQGGVLEKHHGKGAHQAIVQTVIDFTALSAVVQFAEAL
jgi:hypothetical protein